MQLVTIIIKLKAPLVLLVSCYVIHPSLLLCSMHYPSIAVFVYNMIPSYEAQECYHGDVIMSGV